MNTDLEIWNLELKFTPDGVYFHKLKETTDEVLELAE